MTPPLHSKLSKGLINILSESENDGQDEGPPKKFKSVKSLKDKHLKDIDFQSNLTKVSMKKFNGNNKNQDILSSDDSEEEEDEKISWHKYVEENKKVVKEEGK